MTTIWVDAIKNPPAMGRLVIAAALSGDGRWAMQFARLGADGRYYVQVGHHTIHFDGVTRWTVQFDPPPYEDTKHGNIK